MMSEQEAGVNRKPRVGGKSRWDIARAAVEDALVGNVAAVRGLLGPCEIKEYPGSGPSIFGRKCPSCNKENTKEDCHLYLSPKDWKRLHCRSCEWEDTLVAIFLKENRLVLGNECADRIAAAAGVHPNYDDKFTGNKDDGKPPMYEENGQFFIDIEDNDGEDINDDFIVNELSVNINLMPVDKKNWIIESQKEFISKAEAGTLSVRDSAALQYIMKRRGIKKNVIISSGLFIETKGSVETLIYMPSYNCENELAGWQWVNYIKIHNGGKYRYISCPNSSGSSRFPFGLENCDGNEPILMVCGFFDYLSARQAGITRVISPFGVGAMGLDLSHLSDKLSGKTIYILFDRTAFEVNKAVIVAEQLRKIDCKVNVLIWLDRDNGYDFNDFFLECIRDGVKDVNKFFSEMVSNNRLRMLRHGTKDDVAAVISECGIKIGNSKITGTWPGVAANVVVGEKLSDEIQPGLSSNTLALDISKTPGACEFIPDLAAAIGGLSPLEYFNTLVMFTDTSNYFEMCEYLDVKRCPLGEGCICVRDKRMDISDGKFSAAFCSGNNMKAAVEIINSIYEGNELFLCNNDKGWEKTQDGKNGKKKSIQYKPENSCKTWIIIDAKSLFTSGKTIKLVTKIHDIDAGIYEILGFKSEHCGTTDSVFVIDSIKPPTAGIVIDAIFPKLNYSEIVERDFLDTVSSLLDAGIVSTPDVVLTAATCAWSFSPSVIPLLKDIVIGKRIDNYRQPSLSIYAIGDPATGKTNTIREITEACGHRCDPTDAKMATKPGLVISGSDGSPGKMVKSIYRNMGLDEITDKDAVLEIVQLLVQNSLSMDMSGKSINEITPVRMALMSNADATRSKKLHEFRTPMQAACGIVQEHIIRRLDFCVATIPLTNMFSIDNRNKNLYRFGTKENVSNEYLKVLGNRCWVQKPENIEIESNAFKLLLSAHDIFGEFIKLIENEKHMKEKDGGDATEDEDEAAERDGETDEESQWSQAEQDIRIGNPMMYGDVCQKIFRISCGIAGFSGSFVGEKLVVKMIHVKYSVKLMLECMNTMDAFKEAKFNMRSMNPGKAYKTLKDICEKHFKLFYHSDGIMSNVGHRIIMFIQECRSVDPGVTVNAGIGDLYLKNDLARGEQRTAKQKSSLYQKGYAALRRMTNSGLITPVNKGSYIVTETFSRAMSLMKKECNELFMKIINHKQ